MTAPRTDLELLALQAGMVLDGRGRIAGSRGVMLAVSREGLQLFTGSEVPAALVPALIAAVEHSLPPSAPELEPPALDACRAILAPAGAPLALEAGPSYLIEPDVRFETRSRIVRSDVRPDTEMSGRLRQLNPGNWEPEEWDELLDGALGPWAMAVVEQQAVSICHTPRPMTARAAECGVWTHPEFRGQGFAAAVTAAWAGILGPSGRCLFYRTDAENRSSQRVAARLRLRPLGWTWSLTDAAAEARPQRHPLSRASF